MEIEKIINILNYYIDKSNEKYNDLISLQKIIKNDEKIPETLKRLLSNITSCYDINDNLYKTQYYGVYNPEEELSNLQIEITNAINKVNVASIDYTSSINKENLIKEIIANSLVNRTKVLIKNWEMNWKENGYEEKKFFLNQLLF